MGEDWKGPMRVSIVTFEAGRTDVSASLDVIVYDFHEVSLVLYSRVVIRGCLGL